MLEPLGVNIVKVPVDNTLAFDLTAMQKKHKHLMVLAWYICAILITQPQC